LCCSLCDPASLLEVENDADASNRAIRDVVAASTPMPGWPYIA
jgi:hypothetical protein